MDGYSEETEATNTSDSKHGVKSSILYGAGGLSLLAAVWAVLGWVLLDRSEWSHFSGFLPGPSLKALYFLMLEPNFWSSVLASLRRVVVGIFFAFLIGLPCGLLAGFYKKVEMIIHTPVQFVRMISPLAWMPIALLIFTSFESAIYYLITLATVWPILINTMHGVSRVDPQWINMARSQGASDFQLLRFVIIPASVPYVLTSLRLALGVAWIVLVPAEYLGVSSGLGYVINDARDTMEYDRLMAVVIAIGMVGFGLDWAVQWLQKIFRLSWQ